MEKTCQKIGGLGTAHGKLLTRCARRGPRAIRCNRAVSASSISADEGVQIEHVAVGQLRHREGFLDQECSIADLRSMSVALPFAMLPKPGREMRRKIASKLLLGAACSAFTSLLTVARWISA
jgi:hypothetical protein